MSVRIRLIGPESECADAIDALRQQLRISSVSRPYASRGSVDDIRLYVDATPYENQPSEREDY